MAALFERTKAIAVTGAVLVLWFALNLIINLLEVFGPTTPDLYVYLAILIPAALLAVSYVGVAGFRRFLLSIDLRLLIMVQGWRVVGPPSSSFMPLTCCPGRGHSRQHSATSQLV